ncbi:hypothetical protein ECZU17_00380 [Escherichia coli]|nr:hypothetical protein ECZU17_00380 [Escherichia coli]
MDFNADSMTGVMTEIVAITCFCNDPARGIVNLLAAHAGRIAEIAASCACRTI